MTAVISPDFAVGTTTPIGWMAGGPR